MTDRVTPEVRRHNMRAIRSKGMKPCRGQVVSLKRTQGRSNKCGA